MVRNFDDMIYKKTRFTLSNLETAMGININAQTDVNSKYVKAVQRFVLIKVFFRFLIKNCST